MIKQTADITLPKQLSTILILSVRAIPRCRFIADSRCAFAQHQDSGVTLLAGKAVGAPFVGAAAATLALSEVLRLLHGGAVHEVIDLDLKALEYRSAVLTYQDFSALNPGYLLAQPPEAKALQAEKRRN